MIEKLYIRTKYVSEYYYISKYHLPDLAFLDCIVYCVLSCIDVYFLGQVFISIL